MFEDCDWAMALALRVMVVAASVWSITPPDKLVVLKENPVTADVVGGARTPSIVKLSAVASGTSPLRYPSKLIYRVSIEVP